LNNSVFQGIKAKVIDRFSSTPLTIKKITANKDGAITGWAFTNPNIPVTSSMTKVTQSVLTKIPDIYQAGQWAYSPAGLPISIMTGKLAADQVIKQRKKVRGK
jgi:phytoene dehydrogenase-like protein